MIVTQHAKTRLKYRAHVKKKAAKRDAAKAFKDGIKHSETEGSLNRYMTKLFFYNRHGNNVRIRNDQVYIFTGQTLLTVFPVPKRYVEECRELQKTKV